MSSVDVCSPVMWKLLTAVYAVNVPFGYWRAGVPRFSRGWFLAVHLPVPVTVALRLAWGIGWRWVTFGMLVGAFCAGQSTGGALRRWRRRVRDGR